MFCLQFFKLKNFFLLNIPYFRVTGFPVVKVVNLFSVLLWESHKCNIEITNNNFTCF